MGMALHPIFRRERWRIKDLIERKTNALIINALFVQNGRGKTFNWAFFSSDSSFIRWENGERLRLHANFSPHPFGHCVIFLGKKVIAPPSPKVPVHLCSNEKNMLLLLAFQNSTLFLHVSKPNWEGDLLLILRVIIFSLFSSQWFRAAWQDGGEHSKIRTRSSTNWTNLPKVV